MIYTVRVHCEPGEDVWAEVLELPGVFGLGATMKELTESLAEAVMLYLTEKVNDCLSGSRNAVD
jgi:predicted RNase H-like HicB family nuclease